MSELMETKEALKAESPLTPLGETIKRVEAWLEDIDNETLKLLDVKRLLEHAHCATQEAPASRVPGWMPIKSSLPARLYKHCTETDPYDFGKGKHWTSGYIQCLEDIMNDYFPEIKQQPHLHLTRKQACDVLLCKNGQRMPRTPSIRWWWVFISSF